MRTTRSAFGGGRRGSYMRQAENSMCIHASAKGARSTAVSRSVRALIQMRKRRSSG